MILASPSSTKAYALPSVVSFLNRPYPILVHLMPTRGPSLLSLVFIRCFQEVFETVTVSGPRSSSESTISTVLIAHGAWCGVFQDSVSAMSINIILK